MDRQGRRHKIDECVYAAARLIQEHRTQAQQARSRAFFTHNAGARDGTRTVRGKGKAKAYKEKKGRIKEEASAREERERNLMWVRMVDPGWEDLRWSTAATISSENDVSVKTATPVAVRTKEGGRADALLTDILETKRQPPRSMFKPTSRPDSSRDVKPLLPGSRIPTLEPAAPTPPRPPRPNNPFEQKETVSGIRPLSQSIPTSHTIQSNQLDSSSSQSSLRPGSSQPISSLASDGFKKRRFEAKAEGDGSRRGMKMFSVKAKRT